MQTADVTGRTTLNYLQNRGSKHFMAVALFVSVCARVVCVSQANGFTGDGVGYLLPRVIECNDYRCCVM